jgi:hypothetical protein
MWILTALENFWRRLRGNPFQTFVHPPERMGAVLEAAGLVRVARQGTLGGYLTSITDGTSSNAHNPPTAKAVGGRRKHSAHAAVFYARL